MARAVQLSGRWVVGSRTTYDVPAKLKAAALESLPLFIVLGAACAGAVGMMGRGLASNPSVTCVVAPDTRARLSSCMPMRLLGTA